MVLKLLANCLGHTASEAAVFITLPYYDDTTNEHMTETWGLIAELRVSVLWRIACSIREILRDFGWHPYHHMRHAHYMSPACHAHAVFVFHFFWLGCQKCWQQKCNDIIKQKEASCRIIFIVYQWFWSRFILFSVHNGLPTRHLREKLCKLSAMVLCHAYLLRDNTW